MVQTREPGDQIRRIWRALDGAPGGGSHRAAWLGMVLVLSRWHYLHIGRARLPAFRPHGVIEGRVPAMT